MTECPDLAALEVEALPPEVSAHVDACVSCRLVIELFERSKGGDECAQFEALLAAHADGTIGKSAANLLGRHLASCDACRAIADTLAPIGDAEGDHASLPSVDPASYALGLEVARGGMGRILAARDLRVGRPVAVKELLGRSRQLAARFEREARVTARLQHPGIVPIYEIGRWPDGTPFYSMRMVEGRTLREAINAAPTIAARLALLPAVLSAAEAVAFAHSQRVIHRDLTPSNVLVGAYGETVVIDWGLAKDLADATDKDADVDLRKTHPDELTNMGAVIGTLAYMPPEQANGDPVDERADVYSLGAILYHLLAGAAPYRNSKNDELLRDVKAGPPKPVELIAPGAPRDLVSIVAKAMARDPNGRYPSARELTEELKRFQTGRMVEAHEYTTSERLARFVRRNRAAVVVTVTALAVLTVTASLAVASIVREGRSARATVMRLLEEKGRVESLAGNALRAIVYLDAAYKQNGESPSLRVLLGTALRELESIERDLDCGGSVRTIQFSPNGKDVVAACRDRGAVWHIDSKDREPFATLGVAPNGFNDAAYSHDGKIIATWGDDGYARLWDATSGRLLQALHHADSTVTFTTFTPDDGRVATSGYDGWARIWDVRTGALVKEIQGSKALLLKHLYGVLSPDGKQLRTVTFEGKGTGFDVETGEKIGEFNHGALIIGGRQSPDGKRAVTCGMDQLVKVWDLENGGKLLAALAGGTNVMWFCEFSHDSRRVLGTGHDGTAFVWDVETASVVASVKHGTMLNAGHFSYDGEQFVTVGLGGSVKVWDTATGGLIASHETFGGRDARITPDGKRLISALGNGRLRVWRAPFGALQATYAIRQDQLIGASIDGTHVVSTDGVVGVLGSVTITDLATRERIGSPLQQPAAMNPNTNRLVAMTDLTTIAIVDVATGLVAGTLPLPVPPIALALTDSGERVLVTYRDRAPEVFDIVRRTRVATLDDAEQAILDATGSLALAWRENEAPRIWHVDRHLRGVTIATKLPFTAVGFSADRTRVATVTTNEDKRQTLQLTDTTTGARIALLDDLVTTPTLDLTRNHLTSLRGSQVDVWNLDRDTHTTFTTDPLQQAVSDPTGQFVVGIRGQGDVAVVLDHSGRALAQWAITHERPTISQTGFVPPPATAWWSTGGTIFTQSAKFAVWKLSNDVGARKLVGRYVPWRLENDQLVPVLVNVRGRVHRGADVLAHSQVSLEIRTAPELFESITYATTDAKRQRRSLPTDRQGVFRAELAPGNYALSVPGAAEPIEISVSLENEDGMLDIDLARPKATP